MKRFALFSLAFIWLAACDTPSAPTPMLNAGPPDPSFAKLVNDKFPISGTLFHSCAPFDVVAYEGVFHLLITGEEGPTGSDIKIHTNLQSFSGIGVSGDRYSIQQNEKTDFTFTLPSGSSEQETDFRFRMIRQGSDDNLWVRITFRVTNPPFNFEIIRSETECRG